MKKLILLAGIASLAACGGGGDDVDANAMATDDNAMAADNSMAPTTDANTYVGTHQVFDEEGNSLGTTTAMADGTYTDQNADGTTGGGTYTVNDSGQLCFDENGDEEGPTCWTKGESVDGKVRWTNPDGENVMVQFTPA